MSGSRLAARVIGCGSGSLILSLALVYASPLGEEEPAHFVRLADEQGLSQNTVQSIVQDHVGFLWLGTEEGLNRYDGYSFVPYTHDPRDPTSLPDELVTALHEDRRHRLWVGTGRGLCRFDPETQAFRRVPSIQARVNAIAEDRDGTLWVGTEGDGLFRGDPEKELVSLRHDPQRPESLGGDAVSAVLRDGSGRLWVGLRESGLDRLEGDNRFVHLRHDPAKADSLSHDAVWSLAEDRQGSLWVGTYGGGVTVLLRDGRVRHHRHRPGDAGSLRTDLVTCLRADRLGTIWVGGAGSGLHRYDPASERFRAFVHSPADTASLSQDVIRSIYEDSQGQLWVGTYLGGVNVLRRQRRDFRYFVPRPDLPSGLSDIPSSFFEDREGRIWVGTGEGWVNRFEPTSGTFVRHALPKTVPGGAAILSMCQDRRGHLWLGTYRSGLGRFEPERGTLRLYRHDPGDHRTPGNDEMWALAQDLEGRLWLGTNDGLDRFDPVTGTVTAHYGAGPEGLDDAHVRALLCDRYGDLWVGTLGGLSRLRRGETRFVHYRHHADDPDSLSHDAVVALREDRRGRVWAGTLGGGIGLIDPASGKITSHRGFPSNVIYGIQEDLSGRLWLSSNRGLCRFDPETGHVDSFDLTNGLQTLQFRIGASLATRDGRMLFGGVDGFYLFDPRAIAPDTFAPPVVLSSLRVFSQGVRLPPGHDPEREITISYRDRVVSFEFAALDYTFPRRNRYAYLMEGFRPGWVELGTKRDVTFTDLRPGRYTLQVKASNSDGVWGEASRMAVRVTVTPPYWGTWWFRSLAVGLLALALLGIHRLRVRSLTVALAERQRAEQALRRAEEKYRSIFENAFEGLFQLSPEGRFLAANPALARMLGYSSPEALMAEVGDVARDVHLDPQGQRTLMTLVEVQGAVQSFECELRRRDGSTLWVSLNARAVRDEQGDVIRYEGTVEDISGRRHADELRELLQRSRHMTAMGSLVAGVAHEVRNPLFAISANLDAFESCTDPSPETAPLLSTMHREVDRLTALMQELLNFGKPVKWAPSPGSLEGVLGDAFELSAGLAAQREVRLSRSLPDLPEVLMDRKRLVQVFHNLLANAVQHSPPGGTVFVRALRSDERFVLVTVQDEGRGFEAADLPHLFEPFFSRRKGGTGLGLAIVQRIVEEHGGTVTAGNGAAGGAVMSVHLPLTGKQG